MRRIEKYIKSKLKDDTDLVSADVVDSSLTYEEQKTLIQEHINPLLNLNEKLPELINETKQYPITKKDIWKQIRVCFG